MLGEWLLLLPLGTASLFFVYGHEWLRDLSNPVRLSTMTGRLLFV